MEKHRLAIIDLDGTLLNVYSAETSFFFFLVRTGRIPPARMLASIASFIWDIAGKGFRTAIATNAFFLRGEKPEDIADWARQFGRHFLDHAVPSSLREKIRGLKLQGCRVVLLSGSLQVLVDQLRDVIGADYLIGGTLEVEAGRFTGKKTGLHPFGSDKVAVLFERIAPESVDWEGSWALADRYSDLPVLELVGHPVAVNPDRRLRKLARERGWEVMG
jgi:HAD superfamily hydrolase (TIGR01490 family)